MIQAFMISVLWQTIVRVHENTVSALSVLRFDNFYFFLLFPTLILVAKAPLNCYKEMLLGRSHVTQVSFTAIYKV